MNLPNFLTLSRIPLMFAIVGLMYAATHDFFAGAATLAFALFVAAGITDWLDGHLARRRGLVSKFGILMDALTDKILMLGLMIALVDLDRINIVWVLLILMREFLITGMRLVAAAKGVVVSAERAGKQKTLTQILAIGAFLLADVVAFDLSRLINWDWSSLIVFLNWGGLILFLAAVFFTLSSGLRYFLKYRELVFVE